MFTERSRLQFWKVGSSERRCSISRATPNIFRSLYDTELEASPPTTAARTPIACPRRININEHSRRIKIWETHSVTKCTQPLSCFVYTQVLLQYFVYPADVILCVPSCCHTLCTQLLSHFVYPTAVIICVPSCCQTDFVSAIYHALCNKVPSCSSCCHTLCT